MEVVFMDKMFNTIQIIDAYTSCIWNVCYNGIGDFELCLPMDSTSLIGIDVGCYAFVKESDRYMIVETIDMQTSEGHFLTISGQSLESLLTRRIIREDTLLTGSIQSCVMRILNANSIYPTDPDRVLNGLVFKMSTDPAITNLILDFTLKAGDNLYDAIYTICDAYHLGFIIRPLTNGQMEFELYSGKDRSYSQNLLPWVVFSPKFENLNSTDMLVDTIPLKNVLICDLLVKYQVMDESGEVSDVEEMVVIELNGHIKGLDRREIYVDKRSGVSVDSVDPESFGKPEDRVNIRDYQTWEVVYFDSAAYKRALAEYNDRVASLYQTIEKEHTEWIGYEHTPEWQEEHPGENPYYWESVVIPGDSPEDIKRKNAYNAALASRAPKEEDYYQWDWVLTDRDGYQKALDQAQAEIQNEYNQIVSNKVATERAAVENECRAILAEHSTTTRFVGDVDANVNYLFQRDYYLGDLVQIVNEYGFQATTRITEVMLCQDTSSGFIIKPTFKSDDEAVFDI